jgi:WhiB family transcriptional regulator, redox-sensing transcriptional regulator
MSASPPQGGRAKVEASTADRDAFAWQFDAACRGTNADFFFPGSDEDDAAAKTICERCSVRLACLSFAIERGERYGVWGGLSEKERSRLTAEEREQVLAAARAA